MFYGFLHSTYSRLVAGALAAVVLHTVQCVPSHLPLGQSWLPWSFHLTAVTAFRQLIICDHPAFTPLCSSRSSSACSAGRGSRVRASRQPEQALVLWGYDASPFVNLVKETLSELELPYTQVGSTMIDSFGCSLQWW